MLSVHHKRRKLKKIEEKVRIRGKAYRTVSQEDPPQTHPAHYRILGDLSLPCIHNPIYFQTQINEL